MSFGRYSYGRRPFGQDRAQVATATNVNPGVGSITVTGYAPNIAQPQTASPGAGPLTITGYAPTVTQVAAGPQTVLPAAGTLTITGYAPTVEQAAPATGAHQDISYPAKARKSKKKEGRLGGQYVQLEPALPARQIETHVIAPEPVKPESANESYVDQSAKLDVLATEVEHALARAIADSKAVEDLQARQQEIALLLQAREKQQADIAALLAYEEMMRRIDEQDIEILLLA